MAKELKRLRDMKLRYKTKTREVTVERNVVETSFPLLDHAPGCTRDRDHWFYTLDKDTGIVTILCNKCVQTYTFELEADEEEE